MQFPAVTVLALNMLVASSSFSSCFAFTVGRTPVRKNLMRSSRLLSATVDKTEVEESEAKVVDAYQNISMDDIVSLCKRRGFIFPSSEIYNGMAGFYDYGPLGYVFCRKIFKYDE